MRPTPSPTVLGFLNRIGPDGLGLASVPALEILNGLGMMSAGKRRSELTERFHGFCERLFRDRIVDWTLEDARTCARIMEKGAEAVNRSTGNSPTLSWRPLRSGGTSRSSPATPATSGIPAPGR